MHNKHDPNFVSGPRADKGKKKEPDKNFCTICNKEPIADLVSSPVETIPLKDEKKGYSSVRVNVLLLL
jgi:hypothetical protein